ncbi:hypothetical protein FJ364_01565, partial [Candidatus Dependentiae bacterium]|nr:hypothetical protein [Candidatus Dependentiae bacterium]
SSYYDMVKMDCEGAEYEIFESLGDSISRIGHIVLEYHNGSQMIEKYLQENNFDILEVLPSANPKIGLLWATNLKFSYK